MGVLFLLHLWPSFILFICLFGHFVAKFLKIFQKKKKKAKKWADCIELCSKCNFTRFARRFPRQTFFLGHINSNLYMYRELFSQVSTMVEENFCAHIGDNNTA